ncbi:SDR family oxidoreductase [Paenibacillus sp. FSL H8-0457]|uniref:SDR family oxidoreductase n=1 Tax=Bacillales TaxID=1385 RepID=UPI0003E1FB73|nr:MULTISPECIES: SDR family oxidoreductase [Paenibacillus]ETT65051.1 NAD-dependent epimerase/dehydratase [Paenibacillus sp. FSL H8-457]MCM3261435.1 SDR family oxidoreductase [Paenibacillus lautus]
MTTVFVAGAHGKTGTRIAKLLAEKGYQVRGLIPDEIHKRKMEQEGAEGIVGDLTQSYSDGLRDVDAVICAVGAGVTEDPQETDHVGTVRLIEQCVLLGINRFIMISCMETKHPEHFSELKPYLLAKHKAETILEESTLTHTIIRAGELTDDAPAGRVQAHPDLRETGSISRQDVAQAAVLCLSTPETELKAFDLIQGDHPIQDALKGLDSG